MCNVYRATLAACLTVALAPPLAARPEDDAKARPASPRARADALYRYAVGLLQQRDDRLVTAAKTLEEAVRLDPDAIHPRVELIDLYVALGRPDDAAKTAAAVVTMAPAWEDAKHKVGKVWLVLARLRQEMGQTDEAVEALRQCVKHPDLANQPAARAAAACEIGRLLETTRAEVAVTAYRLAVSLYAEVAAGSVPPAEFGEATEGLGRAAVKFAQGSEAEPAEKTKLLTEADAAFAQARDAFTKAGERDRAARIAYHLATVAIARQNWRTANGLLAPYLARRPRDADAYGLYARALGESGGGEAVIAMLQNAIRDQADFIPLKLLLADAYRRYRSRNAGDIEALYRAALKDVPDVSAYRGLFQHLSKSGTGGILTELDQTFRAAMQDGQRVTNEKAGERARAMILALRQEPTIVHVLLNEAISKVSNNFRGGPWGRGRGMRGPPPPPPPFDGVLVLTELAESTRQLDAAADLFRAGLGDNDFNPRGFRGGGRNGMVNPTTYELSVGLLRVLMKAHRNDELLSECQKGLERNDQMAAIFHYFAAWALMRLGRGEEALENAQKAIDGLNDNSMRLSTRLRRLDALAFLGRYDQAIAEGRQLLDSPDFPEPDDVKHIRLALANLHAKARRFETAEALYRAVMELDPDDPLVLNDLGYHLADLGRKLDEAERLIRRALELDQIDKRRKRDLLAADDENAAYLDSLGWVLFRKGRLTEARDWLKKAAALPRGESDAVVWDHLGDVCVRLGNTAEAKAAWEKAQYRYKEERQSQDDARGAEVARKLERLKK
jgi:tetratricopeptide (TPR) repeat protein